MIDEHRTCLELTIYESQSAVLGTMHNKQVAVGPALREGLGIKVVVPPNIDTDVLGTFTGEITRRGSMHDAALAKARFALRTTGLSLALASEGSYGPHPYAPFVPVGLELLVLVDSDRELVISESMMCGAVNFSHLICVPGDDISSFLERIGFPEQGLAVRPNQLDSPQPQTLEAMRRALSNWAGRRTKAQSYPGLYKEIRVYDDLVWAVRHAASFSLDGRAMIETDMRAHQNPTRMLALGELARRLVKRVATPCPQCASPGFGETDPENGLPCEACSTPTSQVNKEVFSCPACRHTEKRPRADGKLVSDPMWCSLCNP